MTVGDTTERDIGRLEGQIMSIKDELSSINTRHRELVEDTAKRLDKIESSLDNITATINSLNTTTSALNAKASQWKIPTAVILGLGTVGVAVLEWAYRKLPDFWGAIR